jgi:hypothetical protein
MTQDTEGKRLGGPMNSVRTMKNLQLKLGGPLFAAGISGG